MPRRVVESRDPKVRAQQRRQLGTLKELTVQPATRVRYDKAVAAFLQFLQDNHLQLPRQRDRIDALAAEYLEHLWVTGAGRGLASDTLAGLQDQDQRLKGMLQTSWRLLKTWHTHEIPCRAPPFPGYVLHCLVGWALLKQQFSFAVSLMVGFYGLLRTGELLSWKNGIFPSPYQLVSLWSRWVLRKVVNEWGRRKCHFDPRDNSSVFAAMDEPKF